MPVVRAYELPAVDELGLCNILLCALGGDGANMAGKILFRVGCMKFGLDGGYDAKYGSEKKGTPTDVCVRFCQRGTPVRQSGPSNQPHYLVVFHADLIEPLELFRGVQSGATCIVNTVETPSQVQQRIELGVGTIICLDATRIAHDAHSRLNVPLLASLCHALGFPSDDVRDHIAHRWPAVAAQNLRAFDAAINQATSQVFDEHDRDLACSPALPRGPIGYLNMLNGGTVDALTHNTSGRDNRLAGRGRVPEFDRESCTSCGICLTVCSDPGGLMWQEGRMVGIDPQFCKGCMRCVEVCPDTKKGKALNAIVQNDL